MDDFKDVTISNIHCDNIRVVSTEMPNKFIARYIFTDNTALHGLLISVIGKEYNYDDKNIEKDTMNSVCEPSIIDGHIPVIISERKKRRDSVTNTDSMKRTAPTMRRSNLNLAFKNHKVFTSRVNVKFKGVKALTHEHDHLGNFTVVYDSVTVELMNDLRCVV